MFTTLLESKAARPRSPGGMAVSAALHALVLFLAVQATLHATQPPKTSDPEVHFVDVKRDEPPPPPVRRLSAQVALPPRGFQTLTAPLNVPDVLPAIDLSRKPTDEADFLATNRPGGRGNGVVRSAPDANQTYSDEEVEKPATALPGTQVPRYPDLLKAAGVEGDVTASFVVDTTGRVDMAHVVILKATHPLFDAAVRAALPGMRFLPAEVGGRRVRQQVQQPFVFRIVK